MYQHPTNDALEANSRPFLKWAGGKQRLLQDIKARLPHGKRLIEPFLGAGSVFLGSSYPSYLLGDANPDLMAVWSALQNRPREFIERSSELFNASKCTAEAYYGLRNEYNQLSDRFERAVLFVYLNRFGFNGIYRVNSKGKFNTPFGRPVTTPHFPWDELKSAADKLQLATLHAGGFRFLMEEAGEGDVVYCDPPYSDFDRASFTAYTQSGFRVAQHEELCCLARDASERGAVVVVSNHDSEHTRTLYSGWTIHELEVRRSVAGAPGSRGMSREVLAVLRG
ncbi:MAG: Dam family site-specific DNA-(adenine-N6)-methyltransferase [Hydrogenophaga sp.]|nr:Dam family site-specific DNA-(adenine-N6)-methyltransferase [Hydrogenophaga sp.]